MTSSIKGFVEFHKNAGIETMPIPYNEKEKPRKGWVEMSLVELWKGEK